jgi:PhnB protein
MDAPQTTKPPRDPSVPEPYSTVCPWIISRDTGKVIEFAEAAFDAKEIGRVMNDDGSIGHAEFFIGESVVLAFDARPHWPATPAFLRIYVPDADATFERAVRAGGEPVTALANMPWGDRAGRIRDPLGNLWWVMARMENVDAAELERRWALPEYVDAMAHATDFDPFPPDR